MPTVSKYFGSLVAAFPHLEAADRVGKDLRADVETAMLAVQADMAIQDMELVTVQAATVDADTIVAPADGAVILVWDEVARTEGGPQAGDAFEGEWAALATWDDDESEYTFAAPPVGTLVVNAATGHVWIFETLMGWVPFCEAGSGNDGPVAKGVARATYDFDVHGGEVGTIPLPASIPPRALITKSYFHVDETVVENAVPGGATISFGMMGGGQIFVASLVGGAGVENYVADTTYDGDHDGAAANMTISGAVTSPLAIAIDVAALTAGKVTLFVEYQQLDDAVIIL